MSTLQEHEQLYKASPKNPEVVQVPAALFAMIDGQGDPNTSQEYHDAVETLYALSYALKFALKREVGLDYRVGPLEGLWWATDMAQFSVERKGEWFWTMMIRQPDQVTPEFFAQVVAAVAAKKNLPALPKVRLERFAEGLCAQVLHIGPYSAEGPTIARLHAFIREHEYQFDDPRLKHHEIYLGDPRRTAPERWKTIIRQPIAPVAQHAVV